MAVKLDHVPYKHVPDWRYVAELVQAHGMVLLPLDAVKNANSAHGALHKFDCGCYAAFDETGAQVGWRIAPITRRHKRKSND